MLFLHFSWLWTSVTTLYVEMRLAVDKQDFILYSSGYLLFSELYFRYWYMQRNVDSIFQTVLDWYCLHVQVTLIFFSYRDRCLVMISSRISSSVMLNFATMMSVEVNIEKHGHAHTLGEE